MAVVVAAGTALAAAAQSATVTGGRPIAESLDLLQRVYGVPVNYEDPPYAYEGDIQDVTDQVRRDPTATARVLVPRGGRVSFTYAAPPVANPTAAMQNAVASLLRSYADVRGLDGFTLIQVNGLSRVVPTRVLDAQGQVTTVRPILDTPITLAPQQTADDVLRLICDLVSVNAGQLLWVATAPRKLLANTSSKVSALNEPASAVLGRLFAELAPHRLAWRVYYGPDTGSYALNIQVLQ